MYDKYTARPAVFYFLFFPFYSALGIIFGAPKRYLYFWGIWSPFTTSEKRQVILPFLIFL